MKPATAAHKERTIDHAFQISQMAARAPGWKEALDQIAKFVRPILIFDNLVLYVLDNQTGMYEVGYARSMGRGRSSEADVYWGEAVVNQVQNSQNSVVVSMSLDDQNDRLANPGALGVPLRIKQKLVGVLVLIRFGGPEFKPEEIELSEFIAQQIAYQIRSEEFTSMVNQVELQRSQARLQEDFISTITHELRNPLGFIKGYTTTLLRSDTTWDQATQQEFLQIIDQETDRLQELIENLLDSARLQAGELRLQFQQVRMDALVNTVITRTKLHHPDVAIHASVDTPLKTVQADSQRITQVLENLISNAIKYAPDSEILITIKQDETITTIIIQDWGPGIPEEFQSKLFERFFRVPSQRPNVHGSGLGLHICKKLIQAHNGDISVDSSEGKGTSFIIRLPMRFT